MNNYTVADVQAQIKPLSSNGFVAFFQKIWRAWLSVWYGFADKHAKLANLIYTVAFFLIFSYGVTIWQYVVMTFLPYAFGSLNNGPWGWPNVPIEAAGGKEYLIFGDVQGLGYFIAFEIAVFTAQCINFPLQRNITYKSHGNPWWQAMWYFIGWVLVSIFTNAIWGIMNCFLVHWGWPDALTGLIKTVLTGGVSMVVFFFIFLIIFPNDEKVAASKKKKYEKLVAANAPQEKIDAAKADYEAAQKRADVAKAEKELAMASSLAGAKAIKYNSLVANVEKAEGEEKAKLEEAVNEAFEAACKAIEEKVAKQAAYDAVTAA